MKSRPPPRSFVGLMTRLDRALTKVEEVLLALLLVGMVVLAAVQVLLRNIWNTAIDWADVSLQNATLILGLLGAAIATSEGRHLNIDLFSRLLKGRLRLLLRVVIGGFALAVCVLLASGGWSTYLANYVPWLENVPPGWTVGQNLREQLLEGNIPQWLTQLVLPFGFGLLGLHFLLRLVRDLTSLATGSDWAEAEGGAELQGDAALDELERRSIAGGALSSGGAIGAAGAAERGPRARGELGDGPAGEGKGGEPGTSEEGKEGSR